MKSCGILFAVGFLGRSRMKKIWWNNFWYLYPDINFVIDGTKILKTIGLFGPNASGKSNILKAITTSKKNHGLEATSGGLIMAKQRTASPSRTMKPVFLIFCEGETEEAYLDYLKQAYRSPIRIGGKNFNCGSL